MAGTLIDLGRPGPAGVEARLHNRTLFIRGSDHPLDWLHHVWFGAVKREWKAAIRLAASVAYSDVDRIVGHSLGGCVAEMVGQIMCKPVVTLGGKRAPKWCDAPVVTRYRRRGDFVPFLPPWRPGKKQIVFGPWRPVWIAHSLRAYKEVR